MNNHFDLSRIEFDLLDAIFENNSVSNVNIFKEKYSERILEQTNITLADKGYLRNNSITDSGFRALEPFAAKRAIFMAAGIGVRLRPITLETPKPLVTVNGQRIINTLIDAVLNAGIEEIVIVRGYLSEQFDILLDKYPMVRFVDNPQYQTTNNISSALCVKDLFSNSYLFEADLMLNRPELIKKYNYSSNFLGYPRTESNDWCFMLDSQGHIRSHKIGGEHCYQEFGISYWDNISGQKLSKHLELAYNMDGGHDIFWTQVPLSVFNDEYDVEVRGCLESDIDEIDTLEELKKLDKSYNFILSKNQED